ncbi:2-amino-4-hydroxy-6-hydroxymethyldihydropteridine diphosphokinase [Paragemmobacter ruber]|uniref:2-amino-4-hydroxy-6-hydroxymethyldihydropteridine pyrophosphokinase n=1 Tax=Paragemmobacter ruber TaxID=1985673 RepID=A0ABW9Y392_9RHOB|nr:2-amino-4-hydroxy-6-hydroxymethyldihydropteridine diphosphokinase [Rhodobacter ruber]NBE06843.1 2-amino-4-hydroxy-6-hydroxymethyldihydropteridine diphosphokinase [Rhodobacter ruber]
MPGTGDCMLIALGANLPHDDQSPLQTLRLALRDLTDAFGTPQTSRIYETPCFPAGAGPDYVNAAIAAPLPGDLTPDQVLARLHAIEERYGRRRETRWGMRTLDLDLVAFGTAVLPDRATWQHWADLPADDQRRLAPDQLILPHPRLQDRAFVLVPLCDVAPNWVHPVTGRSIAQMTAALPAADRAEPRPLPAGFSACQ